jgi:putative endonuclease
MEKNPCVYMLAKASHSTLYTGVTSDLSGRIWQHREGLIRGFTQRYGIKRLVWFEAHEDHGISDPAREADQTLAANMEV